jgi:ElaB/YqjD/DUF883 family membrane-anchored ribosome-binding protein
MTTQTILNNDTNSRMRDALEAAGKVAQVGVDFGLLKKRLENTVDDAVRDAERMAKHGKHATGDVIEDATYCIKRNPWQSIGFTAGAALGIGLCVGWFASRLSRRSNQ